MLFFQNQADALAYIHAEKCFLDFMDYLAVVICPSKSCLQFKGDLQFARTRWKAHNKGAFIRIISDGPHIPSDHIEKWFKDGDHGIIHGIMTAYFSFLNRFPRGIPTEVIKEQTSEHKSDAITEEEFLLTACLFHDFYKSIFGDENHDENLRQIFPNLPEYTFNHAKPRTINDLVIGDRWELLRYPDSDTWLDKQKISNLYKNHNQVVFQKHFRPAIGMIFENLDKVWLRHSPERTWVEQNDLAYSKIDRAEVFPLLGHWPAREDEDGYFSIEVGKWPLSGRMIMGYAFCNPGDEARNNPSCYCPYGLIPIEKIKKTYAPSALDRRISPCARVTPDKSPGCGRKEFSFNNTLGENWPETLREKGVAHGSFICRDHLCAKSSVPLNEWIFAYDDNRHCEDEFMVKSGRQRFMKNWDTLFVNSAGVVNLHLANNLISICEQIKNLLIALRN